MYSEIASSINDAADDLEASISSINSIPISSGWFGSASANLSDKLTSVLESINKQLSGVNSFSQTLVKLDTYKTKKEKRESLIETYNGISNTKANKQRRSNLASEINSLLSDIKTLRKEIISELNNISSVDAGNINMNIDTLTITDSNAQNISGLNITNPTYDGKVLTPSKGRSANGPQAEETWYDLNMGYVTQRMDTVYGIPIETWVDPNTGVKMCKRKGDNTAYVMVAADVHNVWGGSDRNPNARYSMGDVVLTSWGPGMVVDYCGEAVSYREQGRKNRFDIATAWGSGYYQQGQSYATAANAKK